MQDIKKTILDASNFRHACKRFDTNKTITDDDFKTLLEVANLSPSSFGMRGVKLYVITDKTKKRDLKPVCWNQNQIDSCSHLVVFATKTKELLPQSTRVKERFKSRGLDEEATKAYIERYKEFHKSKIASDIYQWGSRQAYIVMANMLMAASMMKIDSCPIEGFEKEKVEKALNIDTSKEEISVIATFGYRVDAQPKRENNIDEIVEFV